MGALLRYTGDAKHPLSFLGEGTRAIQFGSIALFAEAVEWERLPKDMREIIPLMAWAMHMGLLLYFLYDESPNQTRTARLTDGAADLFAKWLTLVKLPVLRPLRRRVIALLTDAGLVPSEAALAPYRLSAVSRTRRPALRSAAATGSSPARDSRRCHGQNRRRRNDGEDGENGDDRYGDEPSGRECSRATPGWRSSSATLIASIAFRVHGRARAGTHVARVHRHSRDHRPSRSS